MVSSRKVRGGGVKVNLKKGRWTRITQPTSQTLMLLTEIGNDGKVRLRVFGEEDLEIEHFRLTPSKLRS